MSEHKSSTVLAGITAIGIWVILGIAGAPEWTFIAGFFFAAFVGWMASDLDK